MRFRKGSRVEVMVDKNKVPASWRVAEIIACHRHTYNVTYDSYAVTGRELHIEKVSRKFIRPCPPSVTGVECWVAGDVVEVYDDCTWKVATVMKVLGGGYYLVKPVGSIHESIFHKLCIRVRLFWENDRWVVIGKCSGSRGDGKSSKITFYQKLGCQFSEVNGNNNHPGEGGYLKAQKGGGLKQSHIASSRALKRSSPYWSSQFEGCTRKAKRSRAVQLDHRTQTMLPDQLLAKVDDVVYPRETMGVTYVQASHNNCSNGYYEMERRKSNGVVDLTVARMSEHSDSDSDECSVGSCSPSRGPYKFSRPLLAVKCQETDTLCSDAESFIEVQVEEDNCSLPHEEEVAESIHRLELHAYRSTLEALYASGPLSWEKEELLSNLRINLNISNDEHLIEIRTLLSPCAGSLKL